MVITSKLKVVCGLAAIFGCAATAHASAIIYNFSSGYITLSALLGTTDILAAGQQIALTGTQVTFDTAIPELDSFTFSDLGPTSVTGVGTFAGTTLALSALLIGYTGAPATSNAALIGSNTYSFSVAPITATGNYAVNGGTTSPITGSNPLPLSGQITLNGTNQLTLTGINLGTASVKVGGITQTVILKGDVVFNGASPVPLPPAVWLFGSGLALFGLPFARRRLAA